MASNEESESQDISGMRGVVSFDTNEIIVLIRAPVQDVAAAFKVWRKLNVHIPEMMGRTVKAGNAGYLVYRLIGHPWTIIDSYIGRDYLKPKDAASLSKSLNTRAIFYGNSDTAGVTAYELFDAGKRLERFENGDDGVEFESTLRDETEGADEETDPCDFVEAFMVSQDALAPGWSTHLGGWRFKPGQEMKFNFFDAGTFERVDYLGE